MAASDNELIRLAQSGDSSAFEALISRHEHKLKSFARIICRDSSIDGDTLYTEGLERIHRGLPSFEGRANFTTWAHTVLRNHFLNLERATHKREHTEIQESDAVHDLKEHENKLWLREALRKMPFSARTILTLHYLVGLSYQEISEMLDIPSGTLARKLSEGRASLKRLMEGEAEKPKHDSAGIDLGFCSVGSRLFLAYLRGSLESIKAEEWIDHFTVCPTCCATLDRGIEQTWEEDKP